MACGKVAISRLFTGLPKRAPGRYPQRMFPTRYRTTASWLLGALCVLALIWLSLPRLLGLAAERWLQIPGVESLRVEIAEIGTGQLKLRKLSGVYRSAGGDLLQIALKEITIDYSPVRRRIDRLDVVQGELEVFPAEKTEDSPWPLLAWPQLPLGEARIHDLRMTMHRAQGAPLQTQGDLSLQQTGEQLEALFRMNAGLLRMAATPGETLEIKAEWQPAAGPGANARVQIARQPTQQPAKLTANAPLALLADVAQAVDVSLPMTDLRGSASLSAEAQLGETTGAIRSISGEAELADVSAKIPAAGFDASASLAGTLRFTWQAQAATLELLPGVRWQTTVDKDLTNANGQLDRPFTLRQTGDKAISEGEFPFTVSSSRWGQWSGAARNVSLDGGPGLADWRAADAQLRVNGQLPRWQQGAIELRDVKANGDTTLRWSRTNGVSSRATFQVAAERFSLSGDSPLMISKPVWKITAEATANPAEDFWKTLAVRGEGSSPQMKLELGAPTERTIALGATRLQLNQFSAPQPGAVRADLTISADAIHAGSTWPVPDLRAHVLLDRGRLRTDGNVLLHGKEALHFDGSHALKGGCGEATLTMQQALSALATQLQPRPPALAPLVMGAGEANARLNLNWCAPPNLKFDAKGTLHARDATIGWEKALAQGVQATAQLDGLHPLRGRVRLAAQRGQLATGTELADLDLDLALTGDSLEVNALNLNLLGGSLHSNPITLPWPPTEKTLPLEIRQFDLSQLLDLFKINGLSGSGQLNGILPVTYRDGAVEVHDGLLNSVGAGTLKYAPSLEIPDNPGLQALRNLHFQKLDMRLNYASGGAYRTESTLEGSNPDFYDGYPVRFTLNINGELPGLFRSALFSGDFNRHILEQLQSGKLK